MNKSVLLVSALVVVLGCGGKKDGGSTTPAGADHEARSGDGNGSAAATPMKHEACSMEIALDCAAGAADGCLDQRTTAHVCVTADSKAGPPCEQEIMLNCAQGQFDACGRSPALASNHVCVFEVPAQ